SAVEGDCVAGTGCGSADCGASRVHDTDAGAAVTQGIGPRVVGADEIALDHVAGDVRANYRNSRDVIPGDQVSVCRIGAANRVVRGEHVNAGQTVALVLFARRVGPKKVPADDVAALATDHDSFVREVIDDQPLNGAVAAGDVQASLEPGLTAVQHNGEKRIVAVGEGVGAGAKL